MPNFEDIVKIANQVVDTTKSPTTFIDTTAAKVHCSFIVIFIVFKVYFEA
jgi:hypothetical protein